MSTVQTASVCCLYICLSSALINFNKHLMQPGIFPYAVPLMTLHVTATYGSCSLWYLLRPDSFPSLQEANFNTRKVARYFIPISVMMIVGITCSNQAYLYCSVAFLQFMKEWNIALVFALSFFAGLQNSDRVRVFIILWIVTAGCVAITGKKSFSHIGFLVQLISQLGETSRIVLQEWLLKGSETHLDPLTYQLFVGPPTIMVLACLNFLTWNAAAPQAFLDHWPRLCLNASIAVILNVTITVLIKCAGGVSFVLAGVVKDIVIVVSAACIAGETLNGQQLLGFAAALCGILTWGLCKTDPDNVIIRGLYQVFGRSDATVTKPLNSHLGGKV